MQTAALLSYLLLVSLCIAFAQNGSNGKPQRTRRRIRYRGLRKGSSVTRRTSEKPQIKAPAPTSPGSRISLINIDDDITEVIDSLIGLDGRESSYNVLPGKQRIIFHFHN